MALRSGGSAGAGCGFQSTRYSARPIPCDLVRPTLDALHCVEKNNSARDVAIFSSTRSESAAVLLEALSEAEEHTQVFHGMASGCDARKLTESLRKFLAGFSRLIGGDSGGVAGSRHSLSGLPAGPPAAARLCRSSAKVR